MLGFLVLFAARFSIPEVLRNDIRQNVEALGRFYRSVIYPHRQKWLYTRYPQLNRKADYREKRLFGAWSGLLTHLGPEDEISELRAPLFYLLPDFMSLSAIAVHSRRESINETWMHLAAQFMLQAVLEVLRHGREADSREIPNEVSFGVIPSGMLGVDGEYFPAASKIIEGTFAYGFIDPPVVEGISMKEAPEEQEAIERQIDSMFRQQSGGEMEAADANGPHADTKSRGRQQLGPRSEQENPSWTQIRNEYIFLFDLEHGGDGSEGAKLSLLETLSSRFPLAVFEAKLVEFISSLWYTCGTGNENGLPVLVQIERGYVKGLDQEEFERFKMRVGM